MPQGQTEATMAGGLRPIRVLIVVVLAIVVVATDPSLAVPDEGGAVAQQVPFESPPDADAKAWSGPLAPLPLWAQVYIISAATLAVFFFVPPAFGSLFRLLRPWFKWLRPKGKHL